MKDLMYGPGFNLGFPRSNLLDDLFRNIQKNLDPIEQLIEEVEKTNNMKTQQVEWIKNIEGKEYFVIEVNVPGFAKEDLNIQVLSQNRIEIDGQTKDGKRKMAVIKTIPPETDLKSIKAKCQNGLLSLMLFKTVPEQLVKIEITD